MLLRICSMVAHCLIFFGCFNATVSEPLVGEKVRFANKNEFPSAVAMLMHKDGVPRESDLFCTGVLVSRDYVLSAAHCLENVWLNKTRYVVNNRDIRRGYSFKAEWAVTYSRWVRTKIMNVRPLVHDIVMIKLVDPVSKNIRIPNLISVPKSNSYGMEVEAAGWGDDANGKTPQRLQTVKLKVLSNQDCAEKLSRLVGREMPMPERFICTQAEPYALMNVGDSGCPIFFNGELIGIHKSSLPFPEQALDPRKINIHSSMEYYKDFVADIIENTTNWT